MANAAGGIVRGDPLARRIGWTNTLAVLALPPVIAAVMGRKEILGGGSFAVAVGLVVGRRGRDDEGDVVHAPEKPHHLR